MHEIVKKSDNKAKNGGILVVVGSKDVAKHNLQIFHDKGASLYMPGALGLGGKSWIHAKSHAEMLPTLPGRKWQKYDVASG